MRKGAEMTPGEKKIELRHRVQILTPMGKKSGCKHHREGLKPRVENMTRLPNKMALGGLCPNDLWRS